MERSHRTRPPDVEEALSSMLWTPYDQEVVESPPYQRRNQIFAFHQTGETKASPPAKLRPITPGHLMPSTSSRFSFPFVSSIGSGTLSNPTQSQNLPSYEDISGNKRLSMPPHPYVVPNNHQRTRGINQSFTDEFISRNIGQVYRVKF